MHLSVASYYPASVHDVGVMLSTEPFVRWRAETTTGPGGVVEQVDVTRSPDGPFNVVVRRTVPTDQIPAQIRPLVGGALELRQAEAWEAESDGTRTGTVALEIAGAPVRMIGTVRLDPADDGVGCVQTYDGEIRAGVPLFGGAIEQAASQAVRSALEAEQDAGLRWLAESQR